MPKLMNLTQLAKLTGISRWTIRYWLRRGEGPPYQRSPVGRFLFREEDILPWLAAKLKGLRNDRSKASTRGATNMEKFLSIGTAAKMIGICRWTLRWWAKNGQAPDFKISPGGHYMFRKSDIVRWLNGLRGPAVIEVHEPKGSGAEPQ
jgi:DNA-binding transcriptional MerR regulator